MFVGLLRFVVFKEFGREVLGVKIDGNCVVWVEFAFLDLFDHSIENNAHKTLRKSVGGRWKSSRIWSRSWRRFQMGFRLNLKKISIKSTIFSYLWPFTSEIFTEPAIFALNFLVFLPISFDEGRNHSCKTAQCNPAPLIIPKNPVQTYNPVTHFKNPSKRFQNCNHLLIEKLHKIISQQIIRSIKSQYKKLNAAFLNNNVIWRNNCKQIA